jgi:sulfhydrogenase subunit gamma (sulfur reductase)
LENPYLPYPVRIDDIITESEDKSLKTFKFVFINPEDEEKFAYIPGQFAELSIPGKGEIPIGIASSPTEKGFVKFTVNKVGLVSSYLHNMSEGEIMGIRGPLGNWYPWEKMEGRNVLIIGAGFAFTTLRSSITYMLHPDNRKKFKNIIVVYAARTPGMFLYKDELAAWEQRDDLVMHLTVDSADGYDWKHNVGLITTVTEEKITSAEDAIAIVCGPPIVIKFMQPILEKLDIPLDRIILSLEKRMKCGIGLCGRCNLGDKFVCKDGPVFSMAQLNELPPE